MFRPRPFALEHAHALHACLQYRRTFPDTHVFNDKGQPLWDRDGMRVPANMDGTALMNSPSSSPAATPSASRARAGRSSSATTR